MRNGGRRGGASRNVYGGGEGISRAAEHVAHTIPDIQSNVRRAGYPMVFSVGDETPARMPGAGGDSPGITMPFVVSVVQNKGGCGKTTLATTLYATAVCRGDSAGIIDLDPQGNASAWCLSRAGFVRVPRDAGAVSLCPPNGALTAARFPGNHLPEQIRSASISCARVPGGFVIPANPYMDRGRMNEIELENVPFGTLVVDTPPFMCSTLLRSVVAQSAVVVVPIQPEPYCVQNVVGLVSEIENAGGGELLETGRVRFVFNMCQKSLTHASWQAVVEAEWGHLVSPVSIPRAMAWADISNHACKWNAKSKPAQIANALWADIYTQMHGRAAA